MENNFGQILLQLVRTNKDKFLGLLRRNGVLVNTNVSNEVLTNTILKAMQKSESFKKEAILLMGVLMSSSDSSFSNVDGPFANVWRPTTDTIFGTGGDSKTTTTDKPKKEFEDTTVGNVLDKLFKLGEGYLKDKEYSTRSKEADTVAKESDNEVKIKEIEKDKDKGNVGLYIGLGFGGLVLVGALVYLIAKKK
jgi:hypothetical protein